VSAEAGAAGVAGAVGAGGVDRTLSIHLVELEAVLV